jgi:hypothetical protein
MTKSVDRNHFYCVAGGFEAEQIFLAHDHLIALYSDAMFLTSASWGVSKQEQIPVLSRITANMFGMNEGLALAALGIAGHSCRSFIPF